MKEKFRMGMVGGGEGAFIGEVHRIASRLDNQIDLVCGVFSSDGEKSLSFAKTLDVSRAYKSYNEMFEKEKELPPEKRMQFVVIVTPNHLHFPVAKMAIENGFPVLSDKPATKTLEEAKQLGKLLKEKDGLYGITYNYSGYPLIQEARERIAQGKLGTIRKVIVEYTQGWLGTPLEETGHKQASWRTNPEYAGISGCMGDIGVHAFHLAEFLTGLEVEEVASDLTTFILQRRLEDDGSVLLRFAGGARGVLTASQITTGEENRLRICIYGEKAGMEWEQKDPNTLVFKFQDKPIEIYRAGMPYLGKTGQKFVRIPPSHPEGYLEAFANLYQSFLEALQEKGSMQNFPSIREAIRGMAFIDAVVSSSQNKSIWTSLKA